MRIINRLNNLEKQAQIKKVSPDAIAIKYNGGEITWDNHIYCDEEDFHSAVNLFFQDSPPTPGPRVLLIRFWREMNDIIPLKSG